MSVDPTIFKAYDIRGEYPSQLDQDIAFLIGKAFGSLFPGRIGIGSDVRYSSPDLKQGLIKGIISTGSEAIDLGNTPTPMIPFAIRKYGFSGGINVTASHNPSKYNGFKLFDSNGIPISYETGIAEIKQLVMKSEFKCGSGSLKLWDIHRDYLEYILSGISSRLRSKLVIDGSNGVIARIYPHVLRKSGLRLIGINLDPDGDFPNHDPDPSKPQNLDQLRKAVLEYDADLGICYDGDGDRLGVVDPMGEIIHPSKILGLMIVHELGLRKGKIVHDLSCSMMIDELIRSHGGIPVVCRVGHAYISRAMIQESCILGGELSGHYYFEYTHGIDDGLFATLKLVEAIQGRYLPELIRQFPDYPMLSLRIPVQEELKFKLVESIAQDLESMGLHVSRMDGVKFDYGDGWGLIRASNTEPAIAVVYESRSHSGFLELNKFMESILGSKGIKLK